MNNLCSSPNWQFRLRQPNRWDRMLAENAGLWDRIEAAGGLIRVVGPFRRRLLDVGNWGEPWLRMPADGVRFPPFVGSIAMPAFDGLDHLVLTFTVPPNYDGVIVGMTQLYTGTGFVEGSGDITWRLMVNQRFPKTLGVMTTSMGSLQQPTTSAPGGVRIQSRQVIQYFVNLLPAAAARLDAGARIVCTVSGWFYPQQ
jgi:hypothetical protein